MSLVDNAIAIRIIYLLITPFNQTDAFKHGIIDATGKPLKTASQLKTNAEKDSYTMLHRLVFRLKRVLGTLPFGQTNLASYAAAYALVKEQLEEEIEYDDPEEILISILNNLENHDTKEFNVLFEKLLEDVPTNTTAGIQTDIPTIKKKDIKKYHLKFSRLSSKKIFDIIPKQKNTLYKINEELIFIE